MRLLRFSRNDMKIITAIRCTLCARKAQALIEIMIAVAVISFVSVSIALAITSSVRSVDTTMAKTTAAFLSQEMTESARAFTFEDWNNINRLATSSANMYFATTSGGKWVHATGTESFSLNGITYSRSFYIDEVYRSTSTNDIVASGGFRDPATLRVTTQLSWTAQGQSGAQTFSQQAYLTRYLNDTYAQTDWSGGSAGEQTVSTATSSFATSTDVNYASTSGSIQLDTI